MKYLGLIKKKEVWALTLRGWLVALIFCCALLTFYIFNIHSFLAVSKPVASDVMAIEGWLPDYALEKIIQEFHSKKYRLLLVTGGLLERGHYLVNYNNYAEMEAAALKKLGLDARLMVVIPVASADKERTYAGAKALKTWLAGSGLPITSINLYSLGAHSRRSWLLFDKALRGSITVGIVALDDLDYDPRYWWKSSTGMKIIITETIAYLHTRLFF